MYITLGSCTTTVFFPSSAVLEIVCPLSSRERRPTHCTRADSRLTCPRPFAKWTSQRTSCAYLARTGADVKWLQETGLAYLKCCPAPPY